MARTEAQKKAVADFNKKLKKAKEHVASGGSKYSWSGGGSSGGFSSADPSLARGPQISAGEYTKKYGGGSGSSQPTQGFSSADPTLARGEQISAGEYTKKYGGGDGRIQPAATTTKTTTTTDKPTIYTKQQIATNEKHFKTSKDVVYSSGFGYSVRPEERTTFVKSMPQSQNKGWISSIISTAKRNKAKRDASGEQPIISPQVVKYAYDWGSEFTLRAGEFLGGVSEAGLTKAGVSEDSFLFNPIVIPSAIPYIRGKKIDRKTTRDIISSAYLFTSLSPFMKTGTSQIQESAYVYDYKTGKFVKKSDIKDYLELSISDKSGKKIKIRDTTFAEKTDRINALLKAAKTPEAKKLVLEAAQESYGTAFLKDFAIQSGYASGGLPTSSITPDIFTPTMVGNIPVMENIWAVGTGVKTASDLFQPSKTSETQWISKKILPSTFSIPTHITPFQKTKSAQDTLQQTKPAQKSGQDTLQKPAQDTLQIPKFAQPTPQIQKPSSLFKSDFNFGPTLPKSKGKIISFWWSNFDKAQTPPSKKQAWLPQVKSKGKWITVSRKPMTRTAALGRASRVVDNTTSAQFRIKKTKGTPSASIDNYFGVNTKKFRPYRIKKGKAISMHNQFIEIRKHRADTRGELLGLTAGKFAKSRMWLPTKPKKKTKSKRRKK